MLRVRHFAAAAALILASTSAVHAADLNEVAPSNAREPQLQASATGAYTQVALALTFQAALVELARKLDQNPRSENQATEARK